MAGRVHLRGLAPGQWATQLRKNITDDAVFKLIGPGIEPKPPTSIHLHPRSQLAGRYITRMDFEEN